MRLVTKVYIKVPIRAKRSIIWLHTFLHSTLHVGDQLAVVISFLSSPFYLPGKDACYLLYNSLGWTRAFMDFLPVMEESFRGRPASSLTTVHVLFNNIG